MTVNPLVPNTGNQGQSQQISSSQGKDAEQAFGELTKSKSYNPDELKEAVDERTRLTRTKKAGSKKASSLSLFLVNDDGDAKENEPEYRTVMVDGVMFTLRLLAVA